MAVFSKKKNIVALLLSAFVMSIGAFVSAQAAPSDYKDLRPPHPDQAGWTNYTRECSTTDRDNSSHTNTIINLFGLNNTDWLDFITIRNPDISTAGTIQGSIPWHKNNYGNGTSDNNCNGTDQGHGVWEQDEYDAWQKFWSSQGHKANMDRVFAAESAYSSSTVQPLKSSGKIDPSDVRWMQVYITWACGFPLKSDGKIGVKTLNAVKYCAEYAQFKPGFYWYLLQKRAEAIDEDAGKECIKRDKVDLSVIQPEDKEGTALKSSITSDQFEEKYGLPLCPGEPCTENCTQDFIDKYGDDPNYLKPSDPDNPETCCIDIDSLGLPEVTDPRPYSSLTDAEVNADLLSQIDLDRETLAKPGKTIEFCPSPCNGSCHPWVSWQYKKYLTDEGNGKCCVDVKKVIDDGKNADTILEEINESNQDWAFTPEAGKEVVLCDDPGNSCSFSEDQITELLKLNTPEKTIFDEEKCCLDFEESDADKVDEAIKSDPDADVQEYDASEHKCPSTETPDQCREKWGKLYDTVQGSLSTSCCLTEEQFSDFKDNAGGAVGRTTEAGTVAFIAADYDAVRNAAANTENPAVCSTECKLEGRYVETKDDGTCACQEGYDTSDDETGCVKVCDIEKCNCGFKFNTRIPWIGRCLVFGNTNNTNNAKFVGLNEDGVNIVVNPLNAFPVLASALTRIGMTFFLLLSFATLIVAGLLMTMEGFAGTYSQGKKLIWKVIISIALIGLTGAVLNAINPNFFQLG